MVRKAEKYTNNLVTSKDLDIELVGREAIDYSKLYNSTLKVPQSFVVTTLCFDDFLTANNLVSQISGILKEVRPFIRETAEKASQKIQKLIDTAPIPELVVENIVSTYKTMFKHDPYLELQLSQLVEEKYVPEELRYKRYYDIKGLEGFIFAIKEGWKTLFDTEAIELRANGYYKGPLSIAIIVKKMVLSEISGFAYSFPPITKEKNTIEIHSMFGLWNPNNTESADIYKVDVATGEIIEKSIVEQDHMYVRSGKRDADLNIKVEISKEWKRRQTLEDELILDVSKNLLLAEQAYKSPVRLTWGIEGGEIYISNVDLMIREEKQSQSINKSKEKGKNSKKGKYKYNDSNIEFEDETLEDLNDEISELVTEITNSTTAGSPTSETGEGKSSLDELHNEILQIVNENKDVIDKEVLLEKKRDLKLINTKHSGLITTLKPVQLTEKLDLKYSLSFDITGLNPTNLNALEYFDSAFLDGTNLIVQNDKLPEKILEDNSQVNKYIESLSIDLSTYLKNLAPKELIYQFSNVSEIEYDKLGLKYSGEHIGDERFIEYPESLAIEALGVKKALRDNSFSIVHISFPSIRNTNNLKALISIANSQGLGRVKDQLKLYAEIGIPSFVHDFENLGKDIIDGVIINYENIVKLYSYRQTIRDVDHDIVLRVIEDIVKHAKKIKAEVYIKVNGIDERVFKKLIEFKPDGFIFLNFPDEQKLLVMRENK